MNAKSVKTLRLITSAVLVALTVVGLCLALGGRGDGEQAGRGLSSLTHFTVQSNLLLGLVSLADVIFLALGSYSRSAKLQLWMNRLLFIATVAVGLTFVVVACFFAPVIGSYAPLIQGANFIFHLVEPVLAFVFFCLLSRDRRIPLVETVTALIPTVLYGLYYLAVVLIKGIHFPETDWYHFASGGPLRAALIGVGCLLVTWLLALLLRWLSGGARKGAARDETPAPVGTAKK